MKIFGLSSIFLTAFLLSLNAFFFTKAILDEQDILSLKRLLTELENLKGSNNNEALSDLAKSKTENTIQDQSSQTISLSELLNALQSVGDNTIENKAVESINKSEQVRSTGDSGEEPTELSVEVSNMEPNDVAKLEEILSQFMESIVNKQDKRAKLLSNMGVSSEAENKKNSAIKQLADLWGVSAQDLESAFNSMEDSLRNAAQKPANNESGESYQNLIKDAAKSLNINLSDDEVDSLTKSMAEYEGLLKSFADQLTKSGNEQEKQNGAISLQSLLS